MKIRQGIKELIEEQGLSIRQLSLKSGVRRQSIMSFLAGANIHIDNLNKIISTLGQKLKLVPVQDFEQDGFFVSERFPIDRKTLKKFCTKHGINKFTLFGSILRSDFKTDSDIDVLIEFEKTVSFFKLAQIEEELKEVLPGDHPLDIVTPGALSKHIRDEVMKNSEVIYDKAA